MAMALEAGYTKPSTFLSKLVVVDVSPIKGRISQQFVQYIKTLKEIQDTPTITSRKEADAYLARVEQDPGVRAFLLTNLKGFSPNANFSVPLDIFEEYVPAIGDFPYVPGEREWKGDTLFVKGTKSAYIKDNEVPNIQKFFPKATFEGLDTGHWVHAEK